MALLKPKGARFGHPCIALHTLAMQKIPMSVLQTQLQITKRLSLIEDSQERLAAVVDRVRKLPPLNESERVESNRIQGCVSRVWIVAAMENERCRFRSDADSTLVRGLASLICEVYDDSTPEEIMTQEANILDVLHLTDHLSPTRRHGLDQVHRAIRDFAARAL
ncbi:MAG: Fe-S metabolism protein SufE [Chthoniobacteraceae bacterium]|nr:Fe-S metabolism protein SufE [Chthoniobacteraceae bacterium]